VLDKGAAQLFDIDRTTAYLKGPIRYGLGNELHP
jgi:hypothetical protein